MTALQVLQVTRFTAAICSRQDLLDQHGRHVLGGRPQRVEPVLHEDGASEVREVAGFELSVRLEVQYFEGEGGAERLVREEFPIGASEEQSGWCAKRASAPRSRKG